VVSTLEYFKALSDISRLRIVHVLLRYELNVNELVTLLDMGQSRVSRHLKILASANLLTYRRDGLWTFYAVPPDGSGRDFLNACQPFMIGDEQAAEDLAQATRILEGRTLKTRQFFNRIAEDWDALNREVLGDFDLPATVLNLMPECDVAADLGCGTGSVLSRLREKAHRLIGVDGSPRMLDLARRRFADSADTVSLRIGELNHLPLSNAETNFACINMVLHHLVDPATVLSEIRRIVKPGGRLLISDFERHNNERMRVEYGDRWLGFERHSLEQRLRKTRFEPVSWRTEPVHNGLSVLLLLARAV
jgi:ArsR family transcriptional regulator